MFNVFYLVREWFEFFENNYKFAKKSFIAVKLKFQIFSSITFKIMAKRLMWIS